MDTRTTVTRGWLVWILAGGAWGCEENRPPPLNDPGDPCRTANHFCLEAEVAMVCDDRVWTATTCEEVCATLGPAYVSDGCDEQCLCVLADPQACEPGETLCVDDDTLEQCSPTQQWEPSSCTDLCARSGLQPVGCEAAASEFDSAQCLCTVEGTPCDEGPPVCADTSTIASCFDATWVFEDCEIVCGGPATCDPWASPAKCRC